MSVLSLGFGPRKPTSVFSDIFFPSFSLLTLISLSGIFQELSCLAVAPEIFLLAASQRKSVPT